jgi:hypothetical protein
MPLAYSSKPSKLKPTTLSSDVLASIGRLVRAFAEIDDLITLYICNLAEISESRAVVLLGRTQASTKLDIAAYLAKMTGVKITALHSEIFGSGYREYRKCRNAVAHGVLLGETEDGQFAFLTSETAEPDATDKATIQVVYSYSAQIIAIYAQRAEEAIPVITENLKLSSLRQTRLERPLQPHRKGLPQQPNKKKP